MRHEYRVQEKVKAKLRKEEKKISPCFFDFHLLALLYLCARPTFDLSFVVNLLRPTLAQDCCRAADWRQFVEPFPSHHQLEKTFSKLIYPFLLLHKLNLFFAELLNSINGTRRIT